MPDSEFDISHAPHSAFRPPRSSGHFQFSLKGLFLATAVCGSALMLVQSGAICPFLFWLPCVVGGIAIRRSEGGRGLKGGAWGGAIPIVAVILLLELGMPGVAARYGFLFALLGAAAGMLVAALYSATLDGWPSSAEDFFYWNHRSLAPIVACALLLFGWQQWIAPYKLKTDTFLTGENHEVNGVLTATLREETRLIVLRQSDGMLAPEISATRFYLRSFLLASLTFIALRTLRKTQTPQARNSKCGEVISDIRPPDA